MNRKFEFKVQPEVLDLRVKIKGVRIHDIDNTVYSSALDDYIDVHVKRLLENNSLESLKKNQVIQGFYELHKEVGIPKRKNLPASENLLKNLLKKQKFHKINPLVDLYNLISMDTKLALGAHDLDKTEGNITLRLTQGNENYIPLGSEGTKEVKAGIYSYIDVHVKRLLKNLLKKQEFHKINPLVDLYNLISMDTKLALGAMI